MLDAALGAEHPELARTLVDIGRCELALRKPKPAISVLERAIAVSKTGGDARVVEDARAELARARAQLGRRKWSPSARRFVSGVSSGMALCRRWIMAGSHAG